MSAMNEIHERQHPLRPLACGAERVSVEQERQRYVLLRVEVVDQVKELKDESQLAPTHQGGVALRHPGERPVGEEDLARGWLREGRDEMQHRALAEPLGPMIVQN